MKVKAKTEKKLIFIRLFTSLLIRLDCLLFIQTSKKSLT